MSDKIGQLTAIAAETHQIITNAMTVWCPNVIEAVADAFGLSTQDISFQSLQFIPDDILMIGCIFNGDVHQDIGIPIAWLDMDVPTLSERIMEVLQGDEVSTEFNLKQLSVDQVRSLLYFSNITLETTH